MYDDRNLSIYQQIIYAVDPSTGTVGNSLSAATTGTMKAATSCKVSKLGRVSCSPRRAITVRIG